MRKANIKETNLLKEQLGSEVTLYDEHDQGHLFHILLELISNGAHYAYFQSTKAEEGEIEVLKAVKTENGEIDLQYIEDDDEWETASELFDEWAYTETE